MRVVTKKLPSFQTQRLCSAWRMAGLVAALEAASSGTQEVLVSARERARDRASFLERPGLGAAIGLYTQLYRCWVLDKSEASLCLIQEPGCHQPC